MSQIKLKYDTAPKTSRGTKLFRTVLFLIFLLLVGYFVVSSAWFLQSVIVPRIGKALNSTLTIGDVELRPFGELTLAEVKLTPQGPDRLFEAKRVYVRYKLLAILRGNIVVEDVVLDGPTINIVEDARGVRNLDIVVGPPGAEKTKAKASSPPRLNLQSVTLRNATLRHSRTTRSGEQVTTELANVNLSVKDIKNGGNGTVTLSAALAMEKTTANPPAKATLPALLNGDLSFALRDNLQLASVKGLTSFSVGRATGEFAELGGLIAKLECDMSPTEIKQFALQFNKGNAALGRVRVSGPFDTETREGKLKLEVLAIDRQVLNLFGAPRGLDFGTTTINGTTEITISQGGRMISPAGRVEVARLQILQRGQPSPTVDLTCLYDLTLDSVGNSLLLKSLNLNGTQDQRPLVNATLSNPLTLAFGDTVNAADASLDFVVTNLNLADWRPFAPGLELAGVVNSRGRLFSRDGGKRLSLEVEQSIKNFWITLGGGPTTVEDILYKGTINHTAKSDTINSALGLNGIKLAGASGSPLQVALDLDAAVSNQVAELRQCLLKLTPTARAKNELVVTGRVDLANSDAIAGMLKVAAESLDITSYYDLFVAKSSPSPTSTAATPTAPPATNPNQEPAPVVLPFNNFTVDASIGRLFLHEVDAGSFQANLRLEPGRVVLQPFQLTLNNAPVTASANIDTSLPGYNYALAFSADGVPVEPLANTFSPTYRGQAKGTLIAKLDLKGAGITGRNLRTNLVGTADFNFTNANIQIVGPLLRTVIAGIALTLKTPELLRSPLDHVTTSLRAGEGQIHVAEFVAQSPALRLESQGAIPIADVLNDSPLNQPVEIALARNYAEKIKLSDGQTNQYVRLPTFVHLSGTLGSPETRTDKTAVAGLAATTLLNNLDGETGQKVGNALNAIGGLLRGSPTTNAVPDASGTNIAGTNPPSATPSLFDLLRKTK